MSRGGKTAYETQLWRKWVFSTVSITLVWDCSLSAVGCATLEEKQCFESNFISNAGIVKEVLKAWHCVFRGKRTQNGSDPMKTTPYL